MGGKTGSEGVDEGNNVSALNQTKGGQSLIEKMAEPNPLVARVLDKQGLIHSRTKDDVTYNVFRELRSQLLQKSPGQNSVTVVSSVVPKGGATHVALNLASAIALDRSKTALVVDCNVYRPAVHEVLALDMTPGLTDFLADPEKYRIEEIIRPTGIPRLRAITAGGQPARNSEFFTMVNMRLLIHMLQQRYSDRYIILDAPPLKAAADARALAELSDQFLVVVPYGRVTPSGIVDACRPLNPKNFAGIVFNKQPEPF